MARILRFGFLAIFLVACNAPAESQRTPLFLPTVEKTIEVPASPVGAMALPTVSPVALAPRPPPPVALAQPTGSPVTALAQPTPSRAPITPTPDPQLRLLVTGAGPQGASLRETPGTGSRLKVLADGTELISLGEDQQAAGRNWKNVKDPDGTAGWVAAEFLTVGETTPVATPAATATPTT